jgi:dihydropteroate synthase
MGTYAHANYDDVVDQALAELRESVTSAASAGIAEECIALDPGIGFAKRGEHSLSMLASLPELVGWGYPVVVGVSRKRFLAEVVGVEAPNERVYGTVGANVAAFERGARIFRVHDVAASRQALDVAWAIARHDRAGTRS